MGPFCKDCVHISAPNMMGRHDCMRNVQSVVSLVTGRDELVGIPVDCWSERFWSVTAPDRFCGPEGRFFLEGEPRIPTRDMIKLTDRELYHYFQPTDRELHHYFKARGYK